MNKNIFAFLLILLIVFAGSCKKDEIDTNPDQDTTFNPIDIDQFIWTSLSTYYLWVDSVPKLQPSYFNYDTDKLNTFLAGYASHENLFYDLLFKHDVVDKWSWIVDDYTELENELQGITKTFGHDFRLARVMNSDVVFGYVRYVLKGSPADKAGIKRGDVFVKVDGQTININNYRTLLFEKDTYKLSFATISEGALIPNDREVTMTAVEFQENPVFLDTVYTINNKKIGYLVYNGFYSDFDHQLNNAFKDFKSAGIQKLILDLRYNGGGSIQTAVYMSSMIHSTAIDKILIKNKFNKELQAYIEANYGSSALNYMFANKIEKTENTPEATISTLGLTELVVITTDNTASASELIINGLKPYMTVATIGSNTAGKYVGSITIKDEDDKGNVNPNHKWALQPIVLKVSNSLNQSDYVNGFAPAVTVQEDISDLKPLGDVNELMLKTAINYLNGVSASSRKKGLNINKVADSKDFVPHSREMYLDKNYFKK